MNATQLGLFDPQTTQIGQATATKPRPKVNLSSCHLIYTPKGRAREYAALACNVYKGCGHGCTYCYAPSATRKTREEFNAPTTRGATFLSKLEKEAAKYQIAGVTGQVLLSFTCDPYQPLDVEERVTRQAIQILHRHGLSVCTLTKGGSRALRDLDLLGEGDAFATTMTFLNDWSSQHWEPGAALPQDRIEALKAFHEAGIPTWVSLEPVLDDASSLEIIRRTHAFVDLFKVGKLNYHPLAQSIDWISFARDAIELLTNLGHTRIEDPDDTTKADRDHKLFYVKKDLAHYL